MSAPQGSQSQQGPQGPQPPAGTPFFNWIRSLGLRRGTDRWIGGVCSGVAHRFGWDPLIVRIIWFALTLLGGIGLLMYGLGWIFLPDERDGSILAQEVSVGRVRTGFIVGCILAVLGITSSAIFASFTGVALIVLIIVGIIGFSGAAHRQRTRSPEDQQNIRNMQNAANTLFDSPFPTGGSPMNNNPGNSQPQPQQAPQQGQQQAKYYPPRYQYTYQYKSDSPVTKNYYYPTWPKASGTFALIVFGILALTGGILAIVCASVPEINGMNSWWLLSRVWAIAALILTGIILIGLGIAGRRAGKFVGIAWLVAIIAFCTAVTSGSHAEYSHPTDVHTNDSSAAVVFSNRTITANDIAANSTKEVDVVFGSTTIDLTDASSELTQNGCPAGDLTLDVVFGGALIILPPGCSADSQAVSTFAAKHDNNAAEGAPATLLVNGDIVFGQLTIQHGSY